MVDSLPLGLYNPFIGCLLSAREEAHRDAMSTTGSMVGGEVDEAKSEADSKWDGSQLSAGEGPSS